VYERSNFVSNSSFNACFSLTPTACLHSTRESYNGFYSLLASHCFKQFVCKGCTAPAIGTARLLIASLQAVANACVCTRASCQLVAQTVGDTLVVLQQPPTSPAVMLCSALPHKIAAQVLHHLSDTLSHTDLYKSPLNLERNTVAPFRVSRTINVECCCEVCQIKIKSLSCLKT
jgi:hypothetical protein